MSATVECIVVFYGVSKLMAVLQAMSVAGAAGLVIEEKESVKILNENEIVDSVGQRIACDLVFENAYGDVIGVKEPPAVDGKAQPLEFIHVNPKSKTSLETLDRVRQAYARLEVLNELKNKGYKQVKEEKLANGSIRLVVQKWQ
jgi:hypothetical protein